MLKKSLIIAFLLLLLATPISSSSASVKPLGRPQPETKNSQQLFRMTATSSGNKMIIEIYAGDNIAKPDMVFDSDHYSIMVFGGSPGQERNISFVDRDPERASLHGSFMVETETFHSLADYFDIIHAKVK